MGILSWRGLACMAGLLALPAWAQTPMRFVTEPFPPYTFAIDGRPAGPMVEVLQAACARLAWSCSIEVLPWRRALNMAQRGEVEGIFTVVDSPERRQYFHVSPPVIEGRYVLFARLGSSYQYAGDPQTLAGRVIGAYGPSATALTLEQLIEGVPRARSEVEPDNRTVVRKLAAGRYGEDGLALANEAVAQHLMREDGVRNLQPAGLVKAFGYSFGLTRQSVDLAQAQALAKTLYELCRSGRTAELLKPYGLPASACVKP
ncbi:substrate-binding periplasmic protein [Roseateles saccharophilus]|uniref:Amino acid ABC transporter substrate-binding protein (PAAT family) n=1 Tax=Roseateles saccharophilus TaxID=304 RepID=A0A4V2VT16_ROSSA|nr:transporter substrate-binding domain-containing protein [Roseateles saccharophilus]MDG0831350.1 transporter substrate-binding domain-containing protein [Roseateles saccharophilus]TCV04480.1 amino acid ABC transporter substrate-binding protein (PAAT family) [Roseateles saccharophilus]